MNYQKLPETKWLWLGFIFLCVTLESVALYYQYALDEWPCVICIQIRMWLALMVVIAIGGLLTRQNKSARLVFVLLLLLVAVALVERSYHLLGVERGFVEGLCSMDVGLPKWLALGKWIPWLFEVQSTCGYTPYIIFKITMAEILMVYSVLQMIFLAGLLILQIKK